MNRTVRRSTFATVITAVAVLTSLMFPLAGTSSANHGNRVLDVEPETFTRGVGTQHTLTARLCDQDANTCPDSPPGPPGGPINIDFENENGPNDPDDANSPLTPDLTCSVPEGQATCTVSFTGTASGDDTITGWIDHDGDNATTEGDDTELRNETTNPGTGIPCTGAQPPNTPEPDCTDVVVVTWTGGAPAKVDCDDRNGDTEHETNPSQSGPQSNETYDCHVRDALDNYTGDYDPNTNGVQDLFVYGEVENGVNDPDDDDAGYDTPDYQCRTGAGRGGNDPPVGRCSITITQSEIEEGTAEICFWADDSTPDQGDENCGDNETTTEDPNDSTAAQTTGNDLADQVELTWEQRSSAEGKGGLDAEPETADRTVGQSHTITGTVYDQFGAPFQGNTTINFEFFAGSPTDTDGNALTTVDNSCTTNNSSSCSITYSAPRAGRDLVCVWINTAPNLQGNNQNGTCDGEGHTDADDTAGSADPAEPNNDDVDVVAATWRNANPATVLNCEPETAQTQRGSSHTVNCTATRDGNEVSGTEIDVEATGANDPDGSNSATTPDFTCDTGDDGECSFTHNVGPSGSLGTTTYRAFTDTDYNDGTDNSDGSEGRDETTAAGGTAEPDTTDVVENTWVPIRARSISLESNRSSQEAGRRIKLSGEVDGDPACEDAETVKLKRRPEGATRSFRTFATVITDGDGDFAKRVEINKDTEYRAVAPATSLCDKAKSNIVTVLVT